MVVVEGGVVVVVVAVVLFVMAQHLFTYMSSSCVSRSAHHHFG